MSADVMRATALRRRIRIEAATVVRDAFGGESITYSLRGEVYAEVKPLSGREALTAQEVAPLTQYEFRIRYRSDVQQTDRVVWKGQAYDIQYLAELGRNVGLRIVAKRPGAAATGDA